MNANKKIMTCAETRKHIYEEMSQAGYSDREIRMFLSGATILGYLHDERASWARDFLVRKYLTGIEPLSPTISLAGETVIDKKLFKNMLQSE